MRKLGVGGGWLGCSSEDPNEIWPHIMEKAYAKMYGGYFSIDNGGKVSFTCSELTNGSPEEKPLAELSGSELDQFFE